MPRTTTAWRRSGSSRPAIAKEPSTLATTTNPKPRREEPDDRITFEPLADGRPLASRLLASHFSYFSVSSFMRPSVSAMVCQQGVHGMLRYDGRHLLGVRTATLTRRKSFIHPRSRCKHHIALLLLSSPLSPLPPTTGIYFSQQPATHPGHPLGCVSLPPRSSPYRLIHPHTRQTCQRNAINS